MNAREYETMFQIEDEHWWYVGIHRLIFSALARLHDEKGLAIWSNLDAGCGTGTIAKDLRRFGQVKAIDMSSLALQFCKCRSLNVCFSQA